MASRSLYCAISCTVRRAVLQTSTRSCFLFARAHSTSEKDTGPRKAKTPTGRLDDKWEGKREKMEPTATESKADTEPSDDPYAPFPDNKNPLTGEIGGPRGPEPTRYGDWERKGRVIDF